MQLCLGIHSICLFHCRWAFSKLVILRYICLGWAIRWMVGYDFVWCKWVLLGLCRVYVSQRRWPDELWASNVQDEGHAQGRQRRSHVWGQLQSGQVFKGQQHATCRQWRQLGLLEPSIACRHNCKACLLDFFFFIVCVWSLILVYLGFVLM